jgi:gamma-glutamylputrescine oxidase
MSLSVWQKESFYAPCEVLLVGAGLLGLWTARELKIKRPSQKVTLIDQFALPAGASVRNAGFACFGSPSELVHDMGIMGSNAMWSLVEMRYRGIEKIRRTFSDQQTGFEPSGGYECYLHENDFGVADHMVELNKGLKAISGKAGVFCWQNGQLAYKGLTGFTSMIENPLEGGLHSGMLVRTLLEEVKAMGVEVIFGLEWKANHKDGSHIRVEVEHANHMTFAIQASQVVFTSNAWLSKQFPELGIRPARGQVILSPAIPNFSLYGTFHFDEGFYYFRNLGNRLLLGGARNVDFEGETTLDMNNTAVVTNALYQFVQHHIPSAAAFPLEAYDSWSGIMAMNDQKMPLLREVEPGICAAMCCNGMGVALSPVFAEKIAAALIN